MKITVTCINKVRDKNNKILGYVLMDDWSAIKEVSSEDLKFYIKSGHLVVRNLTLTKDNRLVEKALQDTSEDMRILDLNGYKPDNDINKIESIKTEYILDVEQVKKSKVDTVRKQVIDKYFAGSTSHYEGYLIDMLLEGQDEETTLGDLGYTADGVIHAVADMFISTEEDLIAHIKNKYKDEFNRLNINNNLVLVYLAMQTKEVLESYGLASRRQYVNDELKAEGIISEDKVEGMLFIINRQILVRSVNPMEKDSKGNSKIDIRRLKLLLNGARDRFRDNYFHGEYMTYNL